VKAFHFGDASSPLYGVYEEPTAAPSRDCAVLICPAFGHECLRAHRALVQLARQLQTAGFASMRFDYPGTGDSAGATGASSLADCRNSIRTAIAELREISGQESLALVGLRLGAALAAEVVAQGEPVADLALWDPVVHGSEFLRELRFMQARIARLFKRARIGGGAAEAHAGNEELLGYPYSRALREEIEAVDLTALQALPAGRTHVFLSAEDASAQALTAVLRERYPSTTCHVVPDGGDWADPYRARGAVLVGPLPRALATRLAGEDDA
jgi:alpha/beta superfamily hydrolase